MEFIIKSVAVFTLETDYPSKLTEKQMDKVRRIVHSTLRPFHFQMKAYYLSDANYRQRINRLRGIIRL